MSASCQQFTQETAQKPYTGTPASSVVCTSCKHTAQKLDNRCLTAREMLRRQVNIATKKPPANHVGHTHVLACCAPAYRCCVLNCCVQNNSGHIWAHLHTVRRPKGHCCDRWPQLKQNPGDRATNFAYAAAPARLACKGRLHKSQGKAC